MKVFFIILSILYSIASLAVPARHVRKTISLADGNRVEVVLKGDESFHYYEDNIGNRYVQDDKAGYQKLNEYTSLNTRTTRFANKRRTAPSTRAEFASEEKYSFIGQRRGLVILANFSDRKLTYKQSDFDDYFNKEGYSEHGNAGSVHDYFRDNSYGQFDLTFDVIGPVTLSKSIQYYGKNDMNGDDLHAAEMVGEAVRLADNEGVDFSKYDWDGDGYVDQVYVIYAGYGEASDAPAFTIWPHEFELSYAKYLGDGNGAIRLDGVTVDTYACSNELFGNRGSKMDGIGTPCHEFSHCLGLPDFYNTNYEAFGMNVWSVMDYGNYNNDGYCPVGYTSYERWYCGWLEPIVLNEPCDIQDIPSLNDKPVAYIIYNDAYKDEYYMIENRQNDGWFEYDCGHGLLILHVDYNKTEWMNNTVNNTASHQRMTVIPADNKLDYYTVSSLKGDLWPGINNNTELSRTSTPSTKLFHYNVDKTRYMTYSLYNICEDSEKKTVSFRCDTVNPADVDTGILTFPDNFINSGFGKDEKYNLNGIKSHSSSRHKSIIVEKGRKYLY